MADNSQSSTTAGAGGGAPGPSGPKEPREDYLESERYFMAVALLSAKRSRDPKTQVGSCVVSPENKVVGVGFNKMPNGCEGQLPWARDDRDPLYNKYVFVCHAVLNAIVDACGADLKGCSIYTTLFPCNECTKLLIQNGITELVYLSDKDCPSAEILASKVILDLAIVKTRKFEDFPTGNKIEIDFTPMQ